MRRYIFVGGIRQDLKDASASSTDLPAAWIEKNTPYKAETFEYESGAIFRRIGQGRRVKELEEVLKRWLAQDIVLVCYSNGGDLAQRIVAKLKYRIYELHLVAAACEHNFEKAGFNTAMTKGLLGAVYCYCSKKDEALKKAQLSKKLFGWLGLGYGFLGLVGPQQVSLAHEGRVRTIWHDLSHGGWWNKENFERTMRYFVHAA